jgi:hypothetical protein
MTERTEKTEKEMEKTKSRGQTEHSVFSAISVSHAELN